MKDVVRHLKKAMEDLDEAVLMHVRAEFFLEKAQVGASDDITETMVKKALVALGGDRPTSALEGLGIDHAPGRKGENGRVRPCNRREIRNRTEAEDV